MDRVFYENWKRSRVDRIISLLGKEWFEGKEVLELAACYGDVGGELLKLGSDVTFSDVRVPFLEIIKKKFPHSDVLRLDQNKKYALNKKFDLVIHFGVLYHLENWEQDLECALNHTNCLILDTSLSPCGSDTKKTYGINKEDTDDYSTYNLRFKHITEDSLLKCLDRLGVKYIRIDNPNMTTPYVFDGYLDHRKSFIKFLYGEKIKDLKSDEISFEKEGKHYTKKPHQMYLILK